VNDLDPSIMSNEAIAAEMAAIGVRWKALWAEEHQRKEQRLQQAVVMEGREMGWIDTRASKESLQFPERDKGGEDQASTWCSGVRHRNDDGLCGYSSEILGLLWRERSGKWCC
jgi:hypothetical protein